MEALFVVLGFALLGIPVAVIYLLVQHFGVKRELRNLQTQLTLLQERLGDRTQPAGDQDFSTSGALEPDAMTSPEPVSARGIVGPWAQSARVVVEPAADVDITASQDPSPKTEIGAEPPRAVVMRRENFRRLVAWLSGNWFYVASAISLALAGVFLVQYGVENGLLPPRIRVLVALAFGATLIAAGEVIRRRYGDNDEATTAYLPSVFSGAGIVTLFGGILSARLLYNLIPPETALAGMVAVAVVALVLGWFYGPLLAAVGIAGAFIAPFIVGGSSNDPSWLYGYFAVIAALGLGIDAVRRWAWITVLTLVLSYAAGGLVALASPGTAGAFALFLMAVVVFAVLVPVRRLSPDHSGTMVVEALARQPGMPWPDFPARVAFAAMLATAVALVWVSMAGITEFWLATGLLTMLAVLLILWTWQGPALQDVALLPAIGLISALTWQGKERMDVWRLFKANYDDTPEADFPLAVTILLLMAVGVSVLAFWRALASRGSEARFGLIWAAAAALSAPVAAISLELLWAPAAVIGAYPWALHAVSLAALMVVFAERLARTDGSDDRLRMSLPVLSALSALAFAFTILFSETALTLAFVATVVAAAALDRVFRIPQMTAFITVGVVTIGYRVIADPGLDFALQGSLAEVIVVQGGALAGFVTAFVLIAGLNRPTAKTMLDSAAWATAGLLLSILLFRWLDTLSQDRDASHWTMGLYATIWLGLMAAQLQRLSLRGLLRYARILLSVVFGLIGLGATLLASTFMNPVVSDWSGKVLGPPVFNTLAIAYLLPALVLLATTLRLQALDRRVKIGFLAIAAGLMLFWVFTTIRHYWQGAEGMILDQGMSQPELYSYTVALLLVGAGLFYQSLARHSNSMRRAGLTVIGLAVGKVFFVDAAGLTGLTRVFSFLLLGFALAALAWLGRWAGQSMGRGRI